MRYRSDVDGIRAISILSVVIYHAYPGIIPGGFVGVDLFFVISGFLISTILFKNHHKGNFLLIDFYSRRVKRIFPALIFVLIFTILSGWFVLLPTEYKLLGKHIAGGAGFIANLVLWSESGYFDLDSASKPLLHLWSLGIEEQFYIFFPVLLIIAVRKNTQFLKLILILTIISFTINIIFHKSEPIANFYSPLSRFWELMVGSILAYLLLYKKKSIYKQRVIIDGIAKNSNLTVVKYLHCIKIHNLASGVGLILIFIAFFFASSRSYPGTWALLPTFGAFLIILAGERAWLNKKVLSNPILVFIGLISFPLYLWHWVLLSFSHIILGNASTDSIRLVLVIFSIILAILTYYYIEKPIRYGKNSVLKTLGLLLTMCSVLTVGITIYKLDGLPNRVHNFEHFLKVQNQFIWKKSNNADPDCLKKYGGDQYCKITDINRTPTIALIGDSHANHFFIGLSNYFRKKGDNLLHLGVGGCAPFLFVDWGIHPNHGNLRCFQRSRKLYDFVLKSEDIKTVVLSFQHTEYFRNDIKFIDKLEEIKEVNNLNNSYLALKRTIKIFNKAGKKVVLIQDLPNLKYDLKNCLVTRPIEFFKKVCDLRDAFQPNQIKSYNELIDRLEKEVKVTIFKTQHYLHDNFVVNKHGLPAYRDGSHLSESGSMYFSDKYNF